MLLGVTASTHQLVLVGLALFFVVAMLVPTRFLVIAWIYAYFYDGRSRSNLARQNRADFIAALKDGGRGCRKQCRSALVLEGRFS